jgi:glyoxylase-like metal-dependent hydrolase (beta-lactamase superfamily II)
MYGHREIDVRHQGRPHVVCCHAVDDVLIDPGPESSHRTLLEALGDEVPRALLLTHIHFDHAGATGALVRRWPDVEVWVHERGAPHMIDPERLVASARRLYGDAFDGLWGEVVPVPEANVRVLRGGEERDGFRVAYTPGHAVHHVAYLHVASGIAFTGDVAGVRIDGGPVLAPTPPPDIDLEAWRASIAVLRDWAPERLCPTHFGTFADAGAHLDALEARLEAMAERARTDDADGFAAWVREWILADAPPGVAEEYFEAMPPETLWPGLDRYWRKRAER